MARTRASVGAKVSSGKSNKARCSAPPPAYIPSSSGASEKRESRSGGNPVCPRETPKWQKPITNFFVGGRSKDADNTSDDDQVAGPSRAKTKGNIITSDDEDETQELETPKNQELEESIILEPLNGETSHKIDEYYADKDKIEDREDKENIDVNSNRPSSKRCLEADEYELPSKKLKTS